ncbi:hypothetical protein GDO78_021561 [Eleutherodactylus coqui]|uniref:Uncharacterized protein n=1 Tax=Eleutherodactylus coqui TaxID=57060 RepID=A0A8J6EH69_ELECQ|nr:hypothetical protein GDO78_021561 [Eleutherodactylus coqui]
MCEANLRFPVLHFFVLCSSYSFLLSFISSYYSVIRTQGRLTEVSCEIVPIILRKVLLLTKASCPQSGQIPTAKYTPRDSILTYVVPRQASAQAQCSA